MKRRKNIEFLGHAIWDGITMSEELTIILIGAVVVFTIVYINIAIKIRKSKGIDDDDEEE